MSCYGILTGKYQKIIEDVILWDWYLKYMNLDGKSNDQ